MEVVPRNASNGIVKMSPGNTLRVEPKKLKPSTVANINLKADDRKLFEKFGKWVRDEPLDKYLHVLQDGVEDITVMHVNILLSSVCYEVPKKFVTIFNLKRKHWVTLYGRVFDDQVVHINVYDPLYWKEDWTKTLIEDKMRTFLSRNGFKKGKLEFHRLQHQQDDWSCGLHSMAYAYMLTRNLDPRQQRLRQPFMINEVRLRQQLMRQMDGEADLDSIKQFIVECPKSTESVIVDLKIN